MLASSQRLFRVLGMQRVWGRDVDDIDVRSEHLIEIGIDARDAMTLSQRLRMRLCARIHRRAADVFHLRQRLQKLIRDEARSDGSDIEHDQTSCMPSLYHKTKAMNKN